MAKPSQNNVKQATESILNSVFDIWKVNFNLLLRIFLFTAFPFFVTAAILRIFSSYLYLPIVLLVIYNLSALLKWAGITRLYAALLALILLSKSGRTQKIQYPEVKQLSQNIFKNNKPAFLLFGIFSFLAFYWSSFLGVLFLSVLITLPAVASISRIPLKQALKEVFKYLKTQAFKDSVGGILVVAVVTGIGLSIVAGVLTLIMLVFEILPFNIAVHIRDLGYGFIWVTALTNIILAFASAYLESNPLMKQDDGYNHSDKVPRNRKSEKREKTKKESLFIKEKKDTKDEPTKDTPKRKEKEVKTEKAKKERNRFNFENQPNRFKKNKDIDF